MLTIAFLLMTLVPADVSARQKPTTGYAPVNGVKMYYEVHGSGEPVVLLHGAFMTITNNWTGWIGELSKTRKVIAVEMQGHGRTADIPRDITYENLADDVAALLDHLKIPKADLIGYSMGGGVAMQCAIRHPDKVRKVVVISSMFRRDGMAKEALDAFPKLTADAFKGSPIEAEYKKLSPTPGDFKNFVKRILATASKGHDFGADKLRATTSPMFFIHGDADGVRLEHVAEMFRLKGGEIHGDMKPRSASRLAVLPNTTHVTLMQRMPVIVPMVNDFLDAPIGSQTEPSIDQSSKTMTLKPGEKKGSIMQLSIYLLFDGTCKDAMTFYHAVFGGELTMTAVGDSPLKASFPATMHGKILSARLKSKVVDISASDWLRPAEKPIRGNTVCLYLSAGNADETNAIFGKLSEGAEVTDPLVDQPFGLYGAMNDKFGNRWMFHSEKR